jgi:hypothetical protein
MGREGSIVRHGVIAGALAATVLVLWFLIIDWRSDRLFYTPNLLGSVLTGSDDVPAGFTALTAIYTVVHYVLFAVVGIAVTWLVGSMGRAPGLLLGLVVGFLLFDLLFYAAVAITGRDVVGLLGWPSVLFGNIVAGVVMLAYLNMNGVYATVDWRSALSRHSILREGLIAGALGATIVAVWFLISDLIAREMFYTPAALWSAFAHGARDAADVQINTFTVGVYTMIHFAAFIVVGLIAAALVHQAERQPPFLLGLALLLVTFQVHFIGLLAIVANWLLESLAWWNVLIGNLLAAGAMGVYLWRQHPGIKRELDAHGTGSGLEEEAALH